MVKDLNKLDKIVLEARRQAEKRAQGYRCLLYTSDAADERSSVDLGGRRIIKKKTADHTTMDRGHHAR